MIRACQTESFSWNQGMLEMQGALHGILGQCFASLLDLVFPFHKILYITLAILQ